MLKHELYSVPAVLLGWPAWGHSCWTAFVYCNLIIGAIPSYAQIPPILEVQESHSMCSPGGRTVGGPLSIWPTTGPLLPSSSRKPQKAAKCFMQIDHSLVPKTEWVLFWSNLFKLISRKSCSLGWVWRVLPFT